MLVEDDPNDVELTRKAFEKGKILNSLSVVRDGEKALDYLYHKGAYKDKNTVPTPGLIMLDINLPRINGIEVLRHIKNTPVLNKIPVIILATSDRDVDIVKSYDFGVNEFIQKPVSFEKFANTIKHIKTYWILTTSSIC